MQHWIQKFRNAFRGIWLGSLGETSFLVHALAAILVACIAFLLRCDIWEWCVLLLCIAMVMSLELMNSSIEFLAKGLCREENESVGKSLDIASGAVLCASIFASLIGLLVLGSRLAQHLL